MLLIVLYYLFVFAFIVLSIYKYFMQIIIFNSKGGVGKTTFALQLALYYDATIIERDP